MRGLRRRPKACPPGRRIEILVDTKLVASGPKPDEQREQRSGTDIRASRLYVVSRRPLIGALRRACSVALLVAVDILGLALGLYTALVLRTVLYGDTVYWSLLWRAGPREWLPFLIPVTVLVFLQAGLYARRERRAGAGRVVSSLILVALIILSVGLGTGYDFSTTGLIPTAVVTCSLAIGLLRAAYSSFALELMKAAGIRRKVVLVGEARSLEQLHRELGSDPWRHRVRLPRRCLPLGGGGAAAARLVGRRAPGDPGAALPGRADPLRGRLRRADGARRRRARPPRRRQGAARSEHDRAARPEGRVRAGPGRAALRPPPADPDGLGLVREAGLRPRRQRPDRRHRAAVLAAHRARDQARLARPGVLRRPPHRRRRAGVRDAEVPHHGRRRARLCRPSSRTRTRRRERCSRSATIRASRGSAACCGGSRSTSCRSSSTRSAGR